MKRNLICIICPRGCAMTVEGEGTDLTVTGNTCPKGKQYAIDECTHPMRTVTSTVRVTNRPDTMVSVKTAAPVPKDAIFEVMKRIRATTVKAPVKAGAVLVADVFGTDVIATKSVE